MERKRLLGVFALITASLASFIVMFLSFYPGVVYGPDLEQQLAQATGEIPFNDWHPPLMALLWRLGIATTGKVSSLFLAEISIFSLALTIISVSGYLSEKSKLLPASLIALIPLFPSILIQSGRLWKDQFLTFLLVLAISALWISGKKRRHLTWIFVFAIISAAALLLRANGIFAIIFLLPLATWKTSQALFQGAEGAPVERFRSRTKKIISLCVVVTTLLAAMVGYKAVISVAADPTPTHQIDQLLLDDIVNTASVEEINSLDASDGFKEYLVSATMNCADKPRRQNLMWDECADAKLVKLDNGTEVFSGIYNFHDEFMSAWLNIVPRHIPKYLAYRAEMFSHFAFGTWSPSLTNISEHFDPKFESSFKATSTYTDSMLERWTPFLFCPGIYMVLNIATMAFAGKHRKRLDKEKFLFAFWISATSLFWLLSQIPLVPAPDYRYAYLSITLTPLAIIFLAAGFSTKKNIHEDIVQESQCDD